MRLGTGIAKIALDTRGVQVMAYSGKSQVDKQGPVLARGDEEKIAKTQFQSETVLNQCVPNTLQNMAGILDLKIDLDDDDSRLAGRCPILFTELMDSKGLVGVGIGDLLTVSETIREKGPMLVPMQVGGGAGLTQHVRALVETDPYRGTVTLQEPASDLATELRSFNLVDFEPDTCGRITMPFGVFISKLAAAPRVPSGRQRDPATGVPYSPAMIKLLRESADKWRESGINPGYVFSSESLL